MDEIKLLAFGYDDYDVLCLDTLGKFKKGRLDLRPILESCIVMIILELVSADGATKMNILEDYISWGWDVTSGEQFWEPTVSIFLKLFGPIFNRIWNYRTRWNLIYIFLISFSMSKRVKRGRCKTTSLSLVKIIDFEIIKILEMINTVKHF